MIRFKSLILVVLVLFALPDGAGAQQLETVKSVDISRYAGKWYEIASYPNRFQKGCHCTTAEYDVCDKGYVIVHNQCRKDSAKGKLSEIWGKAFIQDNSGNAKLKVKFRGPFKGKYWIIDLADDYTYAVVSHPNKKYLWILSRTPTMDPKTYLNITNRLYGKGFDLTKIRVTNQKCQ